MGGHIQHLLLCEVSSQTQGKISQRTASLLQWVTYRPSHFLQVLTFSCQEPLTLREVTDILSPLDAVKFGCPRGGRCPIPEDIQGQAEGALGTLIYL